MMFIDGDHDRPAPEQDVEAWLPKLRQDGLLCGHDAYHPGVQRALRKLGDVAPRPRRDLVGSRGGQPLVTKPVVWDAFIFNREFDCLDMRIHELRGLVHRHLLIESNTTFPGRREAAAISLRTPPSSAGCR